MTKMLERMKRFCFSSPLQFWDTSNIRWLKGADRSGVCSLWRIYCLRPQKKTRYLPLYHPIKLIANRLTGAPIRLTRVPIKLTSVLNRRTGVFIRLTGVLIRLTAVLIGLIGVLIRLIGVLFMLARVLIRLTWVLIMLTRVLITGC